MDYSYWNIERKMMHLHCKIEDLENQVTILKAENNLQCRIDEIDARVRLLEEEIVRLIRLIEEEMEENESDI